MYWLTNINTKKIVTALNLLGAVILMQSCQNAATTDLNAPKEFIDLPAFFQKEIDSLQKVQPLISKTVVKDTLSEQKDIQIKDWNIELSSFLSIDLNKPVYKGAFQKDSVNNTVTYQFTDPELDINLIKITYSNQQPTTIEVSRKTENLLYSTEEELFYSKGEKYKVQKRQKVTLMGEYFYAIEGRLKQD